MMRTVKAIMTACLAFMAAFSSFGQTGEDVIVLGEEINPEVGKSRLKNHLIAPKGEFQIGLSAMYADFSSEDSDYMLLLQGVNAGASMLKAVPEFSYTFANNHSVGLKLQHTRLEGMVESATADLLGNFSMDLENVTAGSSSIGASVYQRTYIGLDKHGRVGLFWDYILGMTRTKSQFYTGDQSSSYSLKKKYHLGFAPGIIFFPMNNVSVQANICLADISYNDIKAYDSGQVTGARKAFKAQASLNVLDISFGLTIHL